MYIVAQTVSAKTWAVVAAGSNGFSNYRHQADACNAIKLLKKNGMAEENIITLLYDDIASSKSNPFPGKIFNKPTDTGVEGEDVYADCHIDYKGKDVTPQVFLDILAGNKAGVEGKGNGKVLESTADDKVVVFFSDHGAVGLIAFPSQYLYADDLMKTLESMHEKKMYKELVFYLEACESGSMFANLKNDINVYATTASNAAESSWGTYCPPSDKVNGKSVGSCLGDLYSVNFIEDMYASNIFKETLQEDFLVVQKKTAQSHVTQFGDLKIDAEPVSNFFAAEGAVPPSLRSRSPATPQADLDAIKLHSSVDSRDINLQFLTQRYLNAEGAEAKAAASVELQTEIGHRDAVDSIFPSALTSVLGPQALVDVQSSPVIPRSFQCLKTVNDVVDAACGRYSDYSLKYVKYVAHMCESKVATGLSEAAAAHVIAAAIEAKCKPQVSQM